MHGHDTNGFADALYFEGGNYRSRGRDGKPAPLIHNGKPFEVNEYMTDLFTRFAVDAIQKNKDRPFLIYLPYQAVKIPVQPPPELLKRAGDLPGLRRFLAATMIGLDDGVGKILAALKENNLDENTIVFFISDNGGGDSHSLNTPLRGKKDDLYEGGIRVPFLMQWPSKLKGGVVYDRPVSIADVLITSLVAAGIKGPAPDTVDGVDLLPYLTGEAKGDPHRYLFWDPRVTLRESTGSAAVRTPEWKLVRNPKSKEWELYDIDRDISETKNVAGEHPKVVEDLSAALERWQTNGRP